MTLDHFVIAAPNLEIGAAWLEKRTGVKAQTGGKHALMGTHNLLARLGADTYLEIISIDPDAPKPNRPRWFELDQPIAEPQLIHWVVRCQHLEQQPNVAQHGTITPVTRGAYSWKITIPEDGHLPENGILPTLIEWQSQNPSANLEPRGLELVALELYHPDAERINQQFDALGLEPKVQSAALPSLRVCLQTPKGSVWL